MESTSFLGLTVFIAKQGDELVTDSRGVAIAFGRRHAEVLTC
jgi:phage regulator Rha-like protein